MGKLKFKIHFTFIIFGCLLVYFGQGLLFISYLVTLLLHELSHAFVARNLGYNISNIEIIPFGICLNLNSNFLPPKDEIKIALAGPLINFAISLLLFALWWIFPFIFNFTYLFCYANLVTATFNLVPAFPLDGGRIFRAIIRGSYGAKISIRICKILNSIFIIALLSLFIFSLFTSINLTFLFVIFCLLPSIDKHRDYTFIDYSLIKKSKKVLKIKNIYIKSSEKLFTACKSIDSFSYLNLYLYDDNDSFIKIIGEKELLSLVERYSSMNTFNEVFHLNIQSKN